MPVAFESTIASPAQTETQVVDTPVIACDGGNGGLGHPRVYLNVGAEGSVVCPYCSRRFVLAEGAKVGGH
ncbi:zinc-finger domain-containing protein [Magnetospirillum sp. UT-4]|uniref:zinc-finger domain-containing protein n=1 Tax=Magnetospirillum sp. UT-4 TaxID=2681467 RepID=UPI00137DDF16|nr:zinc-finger domain-containing protein [Magnetospirillum sp. UT-4]CAA7623430.1 Protein conserved in bacteria [Magnetospirillum sp. UT-4]